MQLSDVWDHSCNTARPDTSTDDQQPAEVRWYSLADEKQAINIPTDDLHGLVDRPLT